MKALYLLALLLVASTAHAQATCPPGTIPYGTGNDPSSCGPDNSQQQGQPKTPQSSPGLWIDQWGSIATDANKGILGTSQNSSSQADAEKTALADCSAKGGIECKIQLSYRNQCAAMIVGNMGKLFNVNSGETTDSVIKKGMKTCSSAANDCHTYYSACSLPIRIQ